MNTPKTLSHSIKNVDKFLPHTSPHYIKLCNIAMNKGYVFESRFCFVKKCIIYRVKRNDSKHTHITTLPYKEMLNFLNNLEIEA